MAPGRKRAWSGKSNDGALVARRPAGDGDGGALLRLVRVAADDGVSRPRAVPQSPQKRLPRGTSLAQDGHRDMNGTRFACPANTKGRCASVTGSDAGCWRVGGAENRLYISQQLQGRGS